MNHRIFGSSSLPRSPRSGSARTSSSSRNRKGRQLRLPGRTAAARSPLLWRKQGGRTDNINRSHIVRIVPALLRGAGVTLALFALVFPLSLPLGFLVTLCANCRFKPVKWLAEAYIFVMRGTPLMLQLFFFYYGLPFLPGIGQYLRLSSFAAAALSFTLNYDAYFAEIFLVKEWN